MGGWVGGDSVAISDKKRLLKAKAKVVRQRCPLPTFKRWVKTKNKVADIYIYILFMCPSTCAFQLISINFKVNDEVNF